MNSATLSTYLDTLFVPQISFEFSNLKHVLQHILNTVEEKDKHYKTEIQQLKQRINKQNSVNNVATAYNDNNVNTNGQINNNEFLLRRINALELKLEEFITEKSSQQNQNIPYTATEDKTETREIIEENIEINTDHNTESIQPTQPITETQTNISNERTEIKQEKPAKIEAKSVVEVSSRIEEEIHPSQSPVSLSLTQSSPDSIKPITPKRSPRLLNSSKLSSSTSSTVSVKSNSSRVPILPAKTISTDASISAAELTNLTNLCKNLDKQMKENKRSITELETRQTRMLHENLKLQDILNSMKGGTFTVTKATQNTNNNNNSNIQKNITTAFEKLAESQPSKEPEQQNNDNKPQRYNQSSLNLPPFDYSSIYDAISQCAKYSSQAQKCSESVEEIHEKMRLMSIATHRLIVQAGLEEKEKKEEKQQEKLEKPKLNGNGEKIIIPRNKNNDNTNTQNNNNNNNNNSNNNNNNTKLDPSITLDEFCRVRSIAELALKRTGQHTEILALRAQTQFPSQFNNTQMNSSHNNNLNNNNNYDQLRNQVVGLTSRLLYLEEQLETVNNMNRNKQKQDNLTVPANQNIIPAQTEQTIKNLTLRVYELELQNSSFQEKINTLTHIIGKYKEEINDANLSNQVNFDQIKQSLKLIQAENEAKSSSSTAVSLVSPNFSSSLISAQLTALQDSAAHRLNSMELEQKLSEMDSLRSAVESLVDLDIIQRLDLLDRRFQTEFTYLKANLTNKVDHSMIKLLVEQYLAEEKEIQLANPSGLTFSKPSSSNNNKSNNKSAEFLSILSNKADYIAIRKLEEYIKNVELDMKNYIQINITHRKSGGKEEENSLIKEKNWENLNERMQNLQFQISEIGLKLAKQEEIHNPMESKELNHNNVTDETSSESIHRLNSMLLYQAKELKSNRQFLSQLQAQIQAIQDIVKVQNHNNHPPAIQLLNGDSVGMNGLSSHVIQLIKNVENELISIRKTLKHKVNYQDLAINNIGTTTLDNDNNTSVIVAKHYPILSDSDPSYKCLACFRPLTDISHYPPSSIHHATIFPPLSPTIPSLTTLNENQKKFIHTRPNTNNNAIKVSPRIKNNIQISATTAPITNSTIIDTNSSTSQS